MHAPLNLPQHCWEAVFFFHFHSAQCHSITQDHSKMQCNLPQLIQVNVTFVRAYPRPQTSWLKSLSHTLSRTFNCLSAFSSLKALDAPKQPWLFCNGWICYFQPNTLMHLFFPFQNHYTIHPRVLCPCFFFHSATWALQVCGAHWICNSPLIKASALDLLCVKHELWLGELVVHAVKLYWLALITNQP